MPACLHALCIACVQTSVRSVRCRPSQRSGSTHPPYLYVRLGVGLVPEPGAQRGRGKCSRQEQDGRLSKGCSAMRASQRMGQHAVMEAWRHGAGQQARAERAACSPIIPPSLTDCYTDPPSTHWKVSASTREEASDPSSNCFIVRCGRAGGRARSMAGMAAQLWPPPAAPSGASTLSAGTLCRSRGSQVVSRS